MQLKNKHLGVMILGVVSLLISGVIAGIGWPPRIDVRLQTRIGEVVAESAAGLWVKGGKVTLLTRDTEAFPQPALEQVASTVQDRLRKAGIESIELRLVQVDPLRPVDAPAGDFTELIRRGRVGDVIVSLLGPPLLTPEQRSEVGVVRPGLVAFCPGSSGNRVDFTQLFEAGLLHVAIAARAPGRDPTERTLSGATAFDRLFTVTKAPNGGSRAGGAPESR